MSLYKGCQTCTESYRSRNKVQDVKNNELNPRILEKGSVRKGTLDGWEGVVIC